MDFAYVVAGVLPEPVKGEVKFDIPLALLQEAVVCGAERGLEVLAL